MLESRYILDGIQNEKRKMKGIGKKILTAVVALLLLAVPFAVAWGVTNGMNNGTKLMTMAEARALVNQVYTAVCNPSGNSNQLSTAAVEPYEHDYVELNDSNIVFLLSIAKCVLGDSEKNEDYIKSVLSVDGPASSMSGTYYARCKLCKNGVILRLDIEFATWTAKWMLQGL